MKLSEITFIQWMGAVLVVNGAVLGYSNEVADLFGPIWQKHIFSVMTIGSAIVGGFITIFGGIGTQARNVVAAGGQVNVSPLAATALTTLAQDVGEPAIKSTGTIVKAIIVAFALSFLLIPGSAQAQFKTPQQIAADVKRVINPGSASSATSTLDDIATTLAKPFQDIANFIGDDATGAISLATVIPALQDGHGQQCWMAMKQFGDVIKAHPVPITFHVIQDYETLRLLGMATNNLCSNVHCTQVFADATAMAQAASPMPLAIPSLHDLCTKVPQIAVVAPVTVATPDAK